MNYKDKIKTTIRRIQIASRIAERRGELLTVCFSGGKDSQVMLHLFNCAGIDYKAVYNVTTIDYPENVSFIRQQYPGVKFVHPINNFWQLLIKKNFLPTRVNRFCCKYLKEYYGNGIVASGVRREESIMRKKYRVIERDYNNKARMRFYPIIDWLEWEIWQYIEDNDIQVNPCYEFVSRVGCMVCPFASTRQLIFVFEKYPNLKQKMIKTIHEMREKSNFCAKYKDKTDEEILEWWMSKKNMNEYFQPKFNF